MPAHAKDAKATGHKATGHTGKGKGNGKGKATGHTGQSAVGRTVTSGGETLTMKEAGERRTLFYSQFTILVDRSSSMSTGVGDGKTRMDVATEAFGAFVKKVAHKEDRVCVFAYHHEPEFVLSEPAPKVNLRAKGLRSKLVAGGATDMPLAIETAVANMERHNEASRKRTKNKVVNWLVVFTDGDAASRSGRHSRAQVLEMLRAASRNIWNFKVCFIGIDQTPSQEEFLHEMAAAVTPRLGSDGGMVITTAGTDARSLRGVFETASTRIVKLKASITADNGAGNRVTVTADSLAECGEKLSKAGLSLGAGGMRMITNGGSKAKPRPSAPGAKGPKIGTNVV